METFVNWARQSRCADVWSVNEVLKKYLDLMFKTWQTFEIGPAIPRELVTIGILFVLKGGYFRASYRWLERDYGDWFGDGTLPERTRLQRLLKTHQDWCDLLLADPTFFTVIDCYPIELLFPMGEGAVSNKSR